MTLTPPISPQPEPSANSVLSRLHTHTHNHTTPTPPLPLPLLNSISHLLQNPTTPASTISALFTALSQLPPSTLPPNISLPTAIAQATLHARSVLTPNDLRHAAHLIALLASRSDSIAQYIRLSNTAKVLFQAASPAATVDPPLKEALRCVAVVCAIPPDEFHTMLNSSHHSFRSRAGKLVAAATHAYRRPVRILAIDGGGTRAVLALQMLKKIECLTGAPLRDSFDLIAGTSTGGVVAVAAGLLAMSLKDVEELYLQFASEIFRGDPGKSTGSGIYHAGKVLFLNKGVYNSRALQRLYEKYCGGGRLFEHAGGGGTPRVFVLSTQMRSEERGVRTPRPYLHANYRVGGKPRYAHGCLHKMSDALRATTAAPVYFDVFVDECGEAFCDGAVVMNNPTSVAIHEATCLWPDRSLGVVVSVGTGKFSDGEDEQNPRVGKDVAADALGAVAKKNGKLEKQKIAAGTDARGGRSMALRVAQALLESATDTESVHHTLEDLLGKEGVYFRLNPVLPGEPIPLDEYRPEVLARMQKLGMEYSTEGQGAELLRKLCHKLDSHSRQGVNGYGMWLKRAGRSHARL